MSNTEFASISITLEHYEVTSALQLKNQHKDHDPENSTPRSAGPTRIGYFTDNISGGVLNASHKVQAGNTVLLNAVATQIPNVEPFDDCLYSESQYGSVMTFHKTHCFQKQPSQFAELIATNYQEHAVRKRDQDSITACLIDAEKLFARIDRLVEDVSLLDESKWVLVDRPMQTFLPLRTVSADLAGIGGWTSS